MLVVYNISKEIHNYFDTFMYLNRALKEEKMRTLDVVKKEMHRLMNEASGKGKDTITLVLTEEEFKNYGHILNFSPDWTRIHGDEVFVHIKL